MDSVYAVRGRPYGNLSREMKENTTSKTVQSILFVVIFIVFLKSQSPYVVLTLLFILCGYVMNVFFHIYNKESEKSKPQQTKNKWTIILVTITLQITLILFVGLIVWLFIGRKLELFKTL